MTRKISATSLAATAWRLAAQHPRLVAFVEALGAELGDSPRLSIRRLDAAEPMLETLAATGVATSESRRAAFAPEAWAALRALLESESVWVGSGLELERQYSGVAPIAWRGPLALAALRQDERPIGLLLLAATDAARLAVALREPCAVALTNELRWRELASGREAAEAERQALLLRLKRQDISDSIVGADAGLSEVMRAVERVARTDTPVLVLGETGSGKEVVARAVHARSRRVAGPFLRVNCGALPPELIDSELFGHERGSFTGAVGSRRGWFERADGGTLFLDEVGELPAAAQVRLLRVLQDGSFQRVGGERSLNVDVRVVAATNRDLRAGVAAGAFREDLWFRLAVFPIPLPPLRARVQDLPALAAHFSLRAAERLGLPPRMPDAADLALLAAYPWPGNVRELASVIERAAILGDGHHLEVARALGVDPFPAARPAARGPDTETARPLSLAAATREHIETALAQCHGRIEGPFGAARLLEMNPHTLRSRMRKLDIDWARFREGR
jgi:transcriptional regulator with GAF, ATPase, and Fis domain